ncbi:hypothetical protein AB0D49_30685 [Streptomyces sp. NPDC048290]|uniref:hypothetical protein n=1 Tax=Streptomyces sp. NPDC048290 TaxID=3155811 RepID=UPI003422E192
MGSLRVTLRTGLCAGFLTVLTLAPPASAADGSGGTVSVSPSSPVPGGDIALRVTGCQVTSATAVSAAFVSEARLTGSDGTLTGETRIRTALKVGAYAVRITCGDRTANGNIRVAETDPADRPSAPSAAASPTAPVHAGGGGTSARLASDEQAAKEGPGTAHALTGLLLAGAAAVAVILRGARKSRRTP